MNGLDHDYFAKKLNIIARDASNFTPQEMAIELGRLVAVTRCDSDEITQLRQRIAELEAAAKSVVNSRDCDDAELLLLEDVVLKFAPKPEDV